MSKLALFFKSVPPSAWRRLRTALTNMEGLVRSMHSTHSIECVLCTAKDASRNVSGKDYARDLYEAGWRFVFRRRLNKVGPMCPDCAATLEEEKEE